MYQTDSVLRRRSLAEATLQIHMLADALWLSEAMSHKVHHRCCPPNLFSLHAVLTGGPLLKGAAAFIFKMASLSVCFSVLILKILKNLKKMNYAFADHKRTQPN